MADDPREIAGMVEKAMGAGGAPTAEGEELDIALPDSMEDQLPEGIEIDTGEQMETQRRRGRQRKTLRNARRQTSYSKSEGKTKRDTKNINLSSRCALLQVFENRGRICL